MNNFKEISELYHSYLESNNELRHWGIKGQKWGVRRFQNEDGSLTEEGKQRYRENIKTADDPAKVKKMASIVMKDPKIIETKNDLKNSREKVEIEYKKVEPLAKSLDILAYDYDSDSEWRKELKDRYLAFISNKNNLESLNNFSKYSKEFDEKKSNAMKYFISEELKNEYDKIPKNIPLGKLDKKYDKIINEYWNSFDVGRAVLVDKDVPYFGYGSYEKGPAPKEYLDRLDKWFDLQPYD